MYLRKLMRLARNTTLYMMVATLISGTPMVAYAAENSGGTTKKELPKTYTYDPVTKRWSSNTWVYNPESNSYKSAPSTAPAPTPTPAASSNVSPSLSDTATNTATVDKTTEAASELNANNKVEVDNDLLSDAQSGDSNVESNTKAGDAKTGDALAGTTIVNSVHSTVGGNASGVAQFTVDVNGDVTGDITIGPAIKNAKVDNRTDLSASTNVDNDISLDNDIKLNATSGNATVSKNTKAGNATSGNADAIANVLNLINTVVAANKSFIGTINIHGNLNGDILVSPEFIPQLLASNADVSSNVDLSDVTNINDDKTIVNNIKLDAASGDAVVSDNTSAGTAKTGTAKTNLTILNLTGHEVDAANSLLVFVNVLGKWVGMIVDAPGATAAALGNGVINSTTKIASENNLNNTAAITNNINLSALTGDATVTKNTVGGDARTGDATASANIANISTSVFKLTDWFGVLYINVLGQWIGSFGIDTKAGTVTSWKSTADRQYSRSAGAPNMHFDFYPKGDSIVFDKKQASAAFNEVDDHDDANSSAVLASTGASSDMDSGGGWDPLALATLAVVGGTSVSWFGARFWLDRRSALA